MLLKTQSQPIQPFADTRKQPANRYGGYGGFYGAYNRPFAYMPATAGTDWYSAIAGQPRHDPIFW